MDVHPPKNGIFIGIDPYPYLFTKIHAFFPPVVPQRRVAREGVNSPGAEVQRRVQRAVQRRPKAPVAAGHGAVERFDATAAEGDEVLVVGAP